jgi:hypothetical protein
MGTERVVAAFKISGDNIQRDGVGAEAGGTACCYGVGEETRNGGVEGLGERRRKK